MAIDTGKFKDLFANWPSGVSVITCIGIDGTPRGFTANSVISVSMDPPLVLFTLKRSAHSMPHFLEARTFAINALSREQEDISTLFSTPDKDRFGNLAYIGGPATGAPLLDGAWGKLECEMHAQHDAGDHMLFVGLIVSINYEYAEPLVYHRRGYRMVTDKTEAQVRH